MSVPDRDISVPDAPATLRTDQTRIHITRRTARWTDVPVSACDAMDFWAFAAGAANVVMQLSWPQVGHGVAESTVDSGNLLKHPWKRAHHFPVSGRGDFGIRARPQRFPRRRQHLTSPR